MRLYPFNCSYSLGGQSTNPIHVAPLEIREHEIIKGIERNVDLMHRYKNNGYRAIRAGRDPHRKRLSKTEFNIRQIVREFKRK